MKMTRFSPFVVSAFALATVGCQDATPGPTAPDAPLFNFSNGPGNPGNSGVIRFQDTFGFISWDDNLLAFHIRADELPACGGSPVDVLADFQIVTNPAEITQGTFHYVDAPIFVYRTSDVLALLLLEDPTDEEILALCTIVENDWLYRGTHSLTVVGAFSPPVLGWKGHGNVYDPAGDPFRYGEHFTVVFNSRGVTERGGISVHSTGGN